MPCLALVLESGVTNMTLKRTISGMIGTGSLAHNRREFIAENVDPNRVQLNICYQNENLKEVYKELFDDAVERYNLGKRKDRQITNYYDKSGRENKRSCSTKRFSRLEIEKMWLSEQQKEIWL